VFWIDASTTERIRQTLIHIATIATVEHNEAAALYWLSNIKQRWLLLIDNADDPSISLERYFPVGNRGHILITTRRSAHKILGNVGPGFYDFEQLDADDANQLLVRAASKPEYSNASIVSKITKTLSFLALAIIQAGAAITKNMCTFEGYLGFYENGWKKIPRRKSLSGVEDVESPVTKVYQSWEANYDYLEKNPNQVREDAIELLKVFAFLSRENIRFDILRRAVVNAALEREHEQKSRDKSGNTSKAERISWYRTLRALYYTGFSAGSPPPLPRLIRAGREGDDDETYVEELRCALGELVQCSLISWDEVKDTFHMHPLQHRYARERLSLAEQGIWAEAAAMVLSASILLPPLGDGTQHQDFNRQMIPHLDHVRRCRTNVERDTSKMRRHLWRKWLHSPPSFTRHKAMMYGKFSFAFMQHGRWDEAEELQLQVRDFLHTFLGPVHPTSRRISTILSTTLWHLGRPDEATTIHQEVLTVCEDYFGKHHLETLRAKGQLGHILYSRGQYSKATTIQREVVDGFVRELGPDNEETLKAKDLLGRAVKWTYKPKDQNQAMQLHREAISGLESINGPDNTDVLVAKESLARLLVDIGDTGDMHFNEAGILITEVIERRRRTLGKEHPYTLLAMVNAAIVKCAQNAPHEAEELLQTALDIANRNFGKDYFGTLLGRTHLGHVLVQQGRYIDAEEVLRDTAERQKHMKARRGDYHPDRVGALIELAKCYRLQGKIDLSMETCDEAIDGFESWDLADHPLAVELRKARRKLEHHQQLVEQGQPGFDDVSEPPKGKYRPWHVF
jgi:tetratricopeptide (TPR) repeat protein